MPRQRNCEYSKSVVYFTVNDSQGTVHSWPSREEVFDALKSTFNLLSIIVAMEVYNDGKNTCFKVFLTISSEDKTKFSRVKGSIEHLFDESCDWVAPGVKAPLNYIRSASKSDKDLLYNGIDADDLSQNWRNWNLYLKTLNKNIEFDYLHPIVQENSRDLKSLQSQFTLYIKSLQVLIPFKPFKLTGESNWVEDLKIYCNSWKPGMPQPYIYGEPSTGKTSCINRLLFKAQLEKGQIFTPHVEDDGVAKRQYDGYNSRRHTMTLVDEFSFLKMNIDAWKLAKEGHVFSIEMKYKDVQRIKMTGLYIMLSNMPPDHYKQLNLSKSVEDSIVKRIHVIKATTFEGSKELFESLDEQQSSKFSIILIFFYI